MPDEPDSQAAFGQPSGQRGGCGFPVAEFLAAPQPGHPHAPAGRAGAVAVARGVTMHGRATSGLLPGDIVLGDRGLGSYGSPRHPA